MTDQPQTTKYQHPMEGSGSIPESEAASERKDVTGSIPVAGTNSQTTKPELSEYGEKFMREYAEKHGMLPKGSRVEDVTYDPKTKQYKGRATYEG